MNDLPKTRTGMYNPVTGRFLSYPLLHKGLLRPKKFHSQLVVGGLEDGLQLVLDETLLAGLTGAERCRPRFLLGGAVERHIVHPEVHLATSLVIHVVGEEVGYEERLVI